MKKSIISFAVAAMALFSPALIFAGNNDNNDNNTPTCQSTQCVGNCNTKAKPQRPNPFDGLNLTDTQKKQIEALAKPQSAQNAQNSPRAERLAQIKNILTPEQYVQFLENQYLNKPGKGHGKFARDGKNGKFARDGKNGKNGKHGKRGNKAPKTPKAPKTTSTSASTNA